jgi:uncharacterized protein (TIGR03032 family)
MTTAPSTQSRSPDRETDPLAEPGAARREVRFEHSLNLAPLLERLGAAVLVSTYQAGKLVVVGAERGRLALGLHNFDRAMGIAVGSDRIAVGTTSQVWSLRSAPGLATRLAPEVYRDGCFVARHALFTGEIHAHELAWAGQELWLVNTLFSCLCTLDERYSFVPRWRPRFISALAAEDRCHLNGLAVVDGRPRYATAMAETDTRQGWRPVKATAGCLIDVPTGETVARGFAMPHSPRVHQGRVFLLDSGRGLLVAADPADGRVEIVCELPGYTRGLALLGPLAFVGLSKIRETSTFGGVPIAERAGELTCGVAVVELATGRRVALLEFHSGVEEIFDVQLTPGLRNPALSGPHPALDGGGPVWVVPEAARHPTA